MIDGVKQPDDAVGVELTSHKKTHSPKMLLSTIMSLLPRLVTKLVSS